MTDKKIAPEAEILDSDECWRLLEQTSIGRLGVVVDGQPDVFTVSFKRDGEGLVFGGRADDQVKVGFVVSKAVGNAVTRNRVKRRLRHLCRTELATAPGGTRIVVRALPRAASSPDELGVDLSRAWTKALNRVRQRELASHQHAAGEQARLGPEPARAGT